MNLLAIDAACSACSAAVLRGGRIAAAERAEAARGQAERLLPMAVRALAAAGLDFPALTGLAATVGPGSFTGIRAALAAARGLALALGLPVVGVTTFEAVARAARRARLGLPCLVAVETGRADLYVQRFEADGAPRGAPAAVLPEDAARSWDGPAVLAAGTGAKRLAAALAARGVPVSVAPGDGAPDARIVARIAAGMLQRGAAPAAPPAPLYLRPPAARPRR